MGGNKPKKKIAIFVIAYNAVKTLDSTIDRIPQSIKDKVEEIYVFDDCSNDNTYYAAVGYKYLKKLKKLKIYKNEKNLGYGGNQKKGYLYAINKGFDIVVMLHGDGQYAPEVIPRMLDPLENDEADMVFGSRMTANPLKGGMPFYKYLGNKVLTFFENWLLGMNLSEFHSGFRIYTYRSLKDIPFHLLSNGFVFDTEILIQLKARGFKIAERPIPTFYGDEVSNVKVWLYGFDCLKEVIKYRLHKAGLIKLNKYPPQ